MHGYNVIYNIEGEKDMVDKDGIRVYDPRQCSIMEAYFEIQLRSDLFDKLNKDAQKHHMTPEEYVGKLIVEACD